MTGDKYYRFNSDHVAFIYIPQKRSGHVVISARLDAKTSSLAGERQQITVTNGSTFDRKSVCIPHQRDSGGFISSGILPATKVPLPTSF